MNDNKMWALVKETAAPGLALKTSTDSGSWYKRCEDQNP